MERLTEKHYASGDHYMKCSGNCINECTEAFDCEKLYGIVDRLGEIEDILGDDYDLDRLRELVEADMDGRCMIAPVKPGEVAWCGFVQRNPASGETKNIVYPVVLKGWWTGLKCKESDPRLFLFGELHESEEAANEALKGEKDGKSN